MRQPDPSALLLLEFLAWVADRPRCYAETIAAWRASCPRLPIWEDATDGRLVALEPAAADLAQGKARVVLTTAGRAMLAAGPK